MSKSTVDVGAVLAGILFMVIGAVLGADAYLHWDIPAALMWPSLLIAGGVLLVLPKRRSSD